MAQETRDFTLVVDATSIHGCVYLNMYGREPSVQELVESFNNQPELTRDYGYGFDERPMLILGPRMQSLEVGVALGQSSLRFSAIAKEQPTFESPRSLVIDDGQHVAFKTGKYISVGKLIKRSSDPRQENTFEESIQTAIRKWNSRWRRIIRKSNAQ